MPCQAAIDRGQRIPTSLSFTVECRDSALSSLVLLICCFRGSETREAAVERSLSVPTLSVDHAGVQKVMLTTHHDPNDLLMVAPGCSSSLQLSCLCGQGLHSSCGTWQCGMIGRLTEFRFISQPRRVPSLSSGNPRVSSRAWLSSSCNTENVG